MNVSIRCLILGHDDRIARAPERLWLRCDHCRRETPGWTITRKCAPRVRRSKPTQLCLTRPRAALGPAEHRVAA